MMREYRPEHYEAITESFCVVFKQHSAVPWYAVGKDDILYVLNKHLATAQPFLFETLTETQYNARF